MKTIPLRPSRFSLTPAALALALAAFPCGLQADQVPNPTVTASARPFNPSFNATNLFDAANAEYASLSQGAVTVPFTTEVTNGTWQHLVVVYSTPLNRVKFYVNGLETLSGAPSPTLLQNAHEVSIASRQGGSGAYNLPFNGRIDDVRIYNRAITPREIKSLNERGNPPRLTIVRSGSSVTISWFSVPTYTLESSGELPATTWNPVGGVVNNRVTLSAGSGNTFFRLRQQ